MNEPYEKTVGFFTRIQKALAGNDKLPDHSLKMQQILCWCHLLSERNCIAVLPTGYGKSLIFQLLPQIFQSRSSDGQTNIVIVVGPLNSIMADQMSFLEAVGISCGVIRNIKDSAQSVRLFSEPVHGNSTVTRDVAESEDIDFLLESLDVEDIDVEGTNNKSTCNDNIGIPHEVSAGQCSIVFGHPEAFLCPDGRNLLKSDIYQERVIAIVIDEAHCMETW